MIRPTLVLPGLALAAALTASPAFAAEEDFALAFPITAPAGEPVFAIELPAEAYATLTTADLADLVVVDAQGQEQPISLQRPPPPTPPKTPDAFALPLPVPVPRDASAIPGRLALHVRRNADGRLDVLDVQANDGLPSDKGSTEWLVDLGDAARQGIDGLRLTPDGEADFRTRVDVRGSNDLVTWQALDAALPVLRASSGARRIERLDLRFARTTLRYLALRPADGAPALPDLASLHALRTREAESAPLASVVLEAAGVSADGLTVDYASPGPLPAQQAEIQLPEGDGIVEFRLDERIDERWQAIASGTAWRVALDGEPLEAAPIPLWRQGIGALRLELSRAMPAPRLVLRYAPDRVIVMAQGEPPFRLLAGSATQRRQPVAMDEALAAIRQRQGEAWQPPRAAVGPGRSLAGAAALVPRADPGQRWLWAVLALGAILVAGLAGRLLSADGPPPAH